MKTLETTNTAEVLAALFTENTGAHLLDSGGAYGRHWERHQGKTVRDFLAAPELTIDAYGVTRDAYRWLVDRLDYDPVMDAAFQAFLDLNQEVFGYLEAMEEFPNTLGADDIYTINTYNGDSALSQTLQWTQWELAGQTYFALQVHGGCDVRGGYTRPRVFSGDETALYDLEAVSLHCSECSFSVDYWAGRVQEQNCGDNCGEWCGNIDNKIPTDQGPDYGREWQPLDGCPCCRHPLS
jgi:hypothetical protein